MKRKLGALLAAAVLAISTAIPAWAAPAEETKELTVTSNPTTAVECITYQVANDTAIGDAWEIEPPTFKVPMAPDDRADFTPFAKEGYKFREWTMGTTKVEANAYNTCTIAYDAIGEDALTANFDVQLEWSVFNGSCTATADGKPINSGDYITPGAKIVITPTPDEGYVPTKWLVWTAGKGFDASADKRFTEENGTLTFSMLDEPFSVDMTCAEEGGTVTVTASAGKGGKVSPTGPSVYKTGDMFLIDFIPDEGYAIDTVTRVFNGTNKVTNTDFRDYGGVVRVGYSESQTTTVDISVTFKKMEITDPVKATFTTGEGGKVSPEGEHTYQKGQSVGLTIEADSGYFYYGYLLNDNFSISEKLSDNRFLMSFNDLITMTEDCAYKYLFAKLGADGKIIPPDGFPAPGETLYTATAGVGGSVSPSGEHRFKYTDDITFTVTPEEGYEIFEIYHNGKVLTNTDGKPTGQGSKEAIDITINAGTDINPNGAGFCKIKATFAKKDGGVTIVGLPDNQEIPEDQKAQGVDADTDGLQDLADRTNQDVALIPEQKPVKEAPEVIKDPRMVLEIILRVNNQEYNKKLNRSVTLRLLVPDAVADSPYLNIFHKNARPEARRRGVGFTVEDPDPNDGLKTVVVTVDRFSTFVFADSPAPTETSTSSRSSGGSSMVGFTSYVITATAGAGGSISSPGETRYDAGTNVTYTITPNAGYAVDKVIVDGKNEVSLTNGTYTFRLLNQPYTIEATFKPVSGGAAQPSAPAAAAPNPATGDSWFSHLFF